MDHKGGDLATRIRVRKVERAETGDGQKEGRGGSELAAALDASGYGKAEERLDGKRDAITMR